MVHLKILSGKRAGAEFSFDRLPVKIGRSSECHVALDEPGVWDQHCEITWPPREALVVSAQPNAILRINDEETQSAPLRNGDVLSLGGLQLRFSLTPIRQRSLVIREVLTWVALAGLCAGQVALFFRLLE